MTTTSHVAAAKQSALEARRLAEKAEQDYRRTVAAAVAEWRLEGLSIRKCADRLGITEGSLRDLLRPEGTPRRAKRRTTPKPQPSAE